MPVEKTEARVARIPSDIITQAAAATVADTVATAQAAAPVQQKLIEDGTVHARKFMEDGAAQARAAMEKGVEQATKATQDAVEFSRGNLEAATQVTQIYFAGVQDLSKQSFAFFQGFAEQAVQNAKAMTSVKSLKEAAELQASFAKSSLEKSVAETQKLSEATYRLAEQLAAPMAARFTLAMEKASKPLAI